MDFDQTLKRLDPKICERHDAFVAWPIDPDKSILLIHFIGNVAQPVLVFTEHLGDTRNGIDMTWPTLLTGATSGRGGSDRGSRLPPIPGQQFVEAMRGVGGDASEDIRQPSLRIDAIHFGRDDEAIHGGSALPAAV